MSSPSTSNPPSRTTKIRTAPTPLPVHLRAKVKGVTGKDWIRSSVLAVTDNTSPGGRALKEVRRCAGVTGLIPEYGDRAVYFVGGHHGWASMATLLVGDISRPSSLEVRTMTYDERGRPENRLSRVHLIGEIFSRLDSTLLNTLSAINGPQRTLDSLRDYSDQSLADLVAFMTSAHGTLNTNELSSPAEWNELLKVFASRNRQAVGFALASSGLAVSLTGIGWHEAAGSSCSPMSGSIRQLLVEPMKIAVINQSVKTGLENQSSFRTSTEALKKIAEMPRRPDSIIESLAVEGMVLKVTLKQAVRPKKIKHMDAVFVAEDPDVIKKTMGAICFHMHMQSTMTAFPETTAYFDRGCTKKAVHPNIGSGGSVCLGDLQHERNHWGESQFRGSESLMPSFGDLITMMSQINLDSPYWGRSEWDRVVTVQPSFEYLDENHPLKKKDERAQAMKMSPEALWNQYGPRCVPGFKMINTDFNDMQKLLEQIND